ncbi:hypothetical protein ACWE42_14745 [Sutcliffiella cohnii]
MFTEEQMDCFKILGEAFAIRFKLLAEAAKAMGKSLEQAIQQFDEINQLSYEEPIHPAARKSKLGNSFMKSQVTLRKPLFIRARSSC